MAAPAGSDAGGREELVASLAAQLGSSREARWIVDDVASRAAGAGHRRPDGRRLEREARVLAARREAGEPLQYVLGRWPFRTLDLVVDRRVLLPRPETEQVVEVALGELRLLSDPRHAWADRTAAVDEVEESGARVCVDLGTGSGAIALSMAVESGSFCPGLEVWATDSSADALDVAEQNLRGLSDVDGAAGRRVRMAEGDWFGALPPLLSGRVDLVVANPPYVAESDFSDLDRTVRDW